MLFRWLIFQFPRSLVSCPYLGRYWCLAPYINRDSNVSSVKTDFRCKRSFLSIAGAKVQQFGVENKFLGYRFFRGVCKCLTDSALQWYFGNQMLHFDWFWRKWRLVTQNFRKAVISGHGHFRSFSFSIFILSSHYPRPQRVFRQSLSLLRRKEGTDMKSLKHERGELIKKHG